MSQENIFNINKIQRSPSRTNTKATQIIVKLAKKKERKK